MRLKLLPVSLLLLSSCTEVVIRQPPTTMTPPDALMASLERPEQDSFPQSQSELSSVTPWSADEQIELDRAIELALKHNRNLERSRISHASASLGRVSAERDVFDPSLRAAWQWQEVGSDAGDVVISKPLLRRSVLI